MAALTSEFVVIGFLQVCPQNDADAYIVIRTAIQTALGEHEGAARCLFMPQFCLGKHDFALAIAGNDLAVLDHVFHSILHASIDTRSGIVDYSKISLITHSPIPDAAEVGTPFSAVTFALAGPIEHRGPLNAPTIVDRAKAILGGTNLRGGTVHLLTGLGFHQLCLLFRTATIGVVASALEALSEGGLALGTSTIPLVGLRHDGPSGLLLGDEHGRREREKLSLGILCTLRPGTTAAAAWSTIQETVADPRLRGLREEPSYTFGSYDIRLATTAESLADAYGQVSQIRRLACILSTASSLRLGLTKPPRLKVQHPLPVQTASLSRSYTGGRTLGLRHTVHESAEQRLLEFRTKLTLAVSAAAAQSAVPQGLLEALDLLVEKGVSRETANWFVAEAGLALRQRLSGLEIGALLGRTSGIADDHGGTLRLLLACDRLLRQAYVYMLDEAWPPNPDRGLLKDWLPMPVVVTVFDLPGGRAPVAPPEVLGYAHSPGVPLFIHIPTNKYKPWLSALGIRSACAHIQAASAAMSTLPGDSTSVYSRKRQEDVNDLACTNSLCRFIRRDLLARLLIQHGEVAHSDPDGGVVADEMRLRILWGVLGNTTHDLTSWRALRPAERADRNGLMTMLIEKISSATEAMRAGNPVAPLDDLTTFIGFLNAFIALGLAGQANANVYLSFLRSLEVDTYVARGGGEDA
jgi:hypothetical protein